MRVKDGLNSLSRHLINNVKESLKLHLSTYVLPIVHRHNNGLEGCQFLSISVDICSSQLFLK